MGKMYMERNDEKIKMEKQQKCQTRYIKKRTNVRGNRRKGAKNK